MCCTTWFCLGPLLFLDYASDISNAAAIDGLTIYADDTNLFVYGSDLAATVLKPNTLLSKINACFIAKRLSLMNLNGSVLEKVVY